MDARSLFHGGNRGSNPLGDANTFEQSRAAYARFSIFVTISSA
jgi:hypothetical protein